MNGDVKEFAKSEYPRSKADLFAMFIERGFELLEEHGFNAMITMQSWMFLSSFDELRKELCASYSISSMLHLGPRAFDTIGGEVVQTVAFVIQKRRAVDRLSTFVRLVEGNSEKEKASLVLSALQGMAHSRIYRKTQSRFTEIPGSIFAYWLSETFLRAFIEFEPLSSTIELRKGLTTMDNSQFLRLWHEVGQEQMKRDATDAVSAQRSGAS